MECRKCGEPAKEHSHYCEVCEVGLAQNETAATVESTDPGDAQHPSGQPNEYVEKGIDLSRSYWAFFVGNLKAPSIKGENAGRSDMINASINIVLLALFAGLGIYFQLKHYDTGFSMFGMDVSFKTFFTVFIYMILACVCSIAVLFGILKLFMQAEVSILTVLSRFGSFLTIPTAISAVYFLVALPAMITLASFLGLFLIAGLQIVAMVTLYSFRKQSRTSFDPFYGLIIFYAVFYLFSYVMKGMVPGAFFNLML